ncbi:MAG: cation:proton antiporter [Deltaproteobacteria bacterium]|nr:cation:proton antiporter [Deltaproteobacteria bacterium]
MKIVVGVALVILIALLGSRRTFTKVRLPLAARHIYLTGTEYILVGLCLGGLLLNLLDEGSLKGLDPLLFLSLGWIGLMFGVQLEIPRIAHFGRQHFGLAMLQALATLLFCSLPFVFLLGLIGGTSNELIVIGALTLGAIAVPTAQSSLVLIQKELGLSRNKFFEILNYVSGIDDIIGLIVFGFLFCYAHTSSFIGLESLISLQYLGLSIAVGGLMGLLLHVLTRVRCGQEELLLFTMGIVVLAAGTAAYLGISPLFVTFISGFVIANLRSQKTRILRVLGSFEKPFYIVILLIGGAMLRPVGNWPVVLGLAAAYIVLRLAGKAAGGFVSSLVLRKPQQLPALVGLALTSQGGMAAAMVVSFHRTFLSDFSNSILMLVLVALVVNEIISPFLARFVVRKAS